MLFYEEKSDFYVTGCFYDFYFPDLCRGIFRWNSVVVNDAGTVNGTDADSADSAEIPDTSLFSSDAVDGAGVVNDSVDAGEDSAENAFSDQEVPDVMMDQVVGGCRGSKRGSKRSL